MADVEIKNTSDELGIQLQLYKYLREEIINSINLQHRTFIGESFFISIVFSFSFMQMQTNFKPLILSIAPVIVGFTCLWLIEQSRMMRAGDYLCLLEDKINTFTKEPCLTWENWLRRENVSTWDVHKIHHIAQTLILSSFVVIGYFSTYLIWTTPLEFIEMDMQHGLAITYAILLGLVTFMIIKVVKHRRPKITKRYLFSWDGIPGNDNERLIEFLKQIFYVDWAKTTDVKKSDDKKTIRVSTTNNSLSIRLNDEKTKAILTIDDGRTDEFLAKEEDSKLIIYSKSKELNIEFTNWLQEYNNRIKKLKKMEIINENPK